MSAFIRTVKGRADASIRVFLLVENRLLHQELARLFRKRSDLEVVGESWMADASVCDLLNLQCDVLLITSVPANWLLPHFGLGSLKHLGFKTMLVGMDADEQQFTAAVRSGVTGYLLKDASAEDVVAAVRAVYRGEAVCPPRLCSTLFRLAAKATHLPNATARPDLTLRQQQLVALVAKGLTNKEIASQLNLSGFTVRNHIHRILKRVDARSRSQAVEAIRAYGYSIDA